MAVGDDDDDDDGSDATVSLMRFFSASAYTGFGDGPGAFYAVYRGAFESVWAAEAPYRHGDPASEDDEAEEEEGTRRRGGAAQRGPRRPTTPAPSFGGPQADEHDVRAFYSFWEGFVSRQPFGHADTYRLSEAPTRAVRRLMERENAKQREAVRRAYTDTVRVR